MSCKKGRRVPMPKHGQWTKLSHGFSGKCKSMFTAFIARGPAFKENFEGKPFESVSLYPLMCKILGIEPLPNNGRLDATADLLAQ